MRQSWKMNKDLIETPRFICSLGDEVLLKGRIVGFDVDENKCVENAVRLEYGQTLNVPNCNIYTKNNIIDEPEKIKIPQCVADWIEVCKEHLTTSLYTAMNPNFMKENNQSFDFILWIKKTSNQALFARAWLDGYEVEEEKRYRVKIKGTGQYLRKDENSIRFSSLFISDFTKDAIEDLGFGEVFNSPLFEIEEVE